MTFFDKLRRESRCASLLSKFFNSSAFIAVFAAVCAISGVCGQNGYIACIFAITALSVAAGFFSEDLKVFFLPLFISFYAIGLDVIPEYYEGYNPNADPYFPSAYFRPSSVPYFIICGTLIVAVLLYRLITSGALREMFTKRGRFFIILSILAASLSAGGIFSSHFSLKSVLWGLLIGACLLLLYMLSTVLLSHSKDGAAYIAKVLVAVGMTVSVQVFVIAVRLSRADNLIKISSGHINRIMIKLAWGNTTIIGAIIALAICACFYLMYEKRCRLFCFACALWLMMTVVFVDSRSSILFGAIAFLFGCIFCCIGGRGRKGNRVIIGTFLVLCIAAVLTASIRYKDVFDRVFNGLVDYLRLDHESFDNLNAFSSGRLNIWQKGFSDFLSAPAFGNGFLCGRYPVEDVGKNIFMNMYHNIFVQFLASTGAVGMLVFVFHIKSLGEMAVRYCTLKRMLMLLVPFCIIGMSLVDNFFFYPNFIIYYTAFLAASELDLEDVRQKRLDSYKRINDGRKPKVVFTYVEAGKGHIVPTANVCKVFKEKYGDRVEVVESRFFTETGDKNMEKSEIFFRRAVQRQNRSPLYSFTCRFGNFIFGDAIALFFMLRMTPSGRKTNRLAVKHIAELDADVVYTAHWSIPFYVNQLKGGRPYTVCFCPDAYSNGAFNVDCNSFLISTDVGKKQVEGARMYAGGNISEVPFPMRPEAEEYRAEGKKAECRRLLGIPEDEFTVVLCDGGYGMARLEKTADRLLKFNRRSDVKMTVIALCGTNHSLYLKLAEKAEKQRGGVKLIPVDFTHDVLKYIVSADVFAGKSGANAIAEPASLGVPIIVTKCVTNIERGIKSYYVRNLKGAMYIPSSHLAARRLKKLAKNPEKLEKYRRNLKNSVAARYSPEASADAVFEAVRKVRGDI